MWPEVQLAVLAGRGAVNPHLRRWAQRFDRRRVLYASGLPDHVACLRNRLTLWFRDECPPETRWLLMIDDDVVPLPQTDELLRCTADVASARAWARSGCEAHPHGLSAACLKLSRRAVEAIRPPWFGFVLSADGTRVEACECRHLLRKARQEGFRPVRAGIVGHRFPVVVLPPEAGDEGRQATCGAAGPDAAEGVGAARPVFRFDCEMEHA